ncbi:hypothetical protein Ddc_14749 [Ditylenchus destructor]|nr:hypothetical protein Ddc_14749 [Ditylenchus destructor]
MHSRVRCAHDGIDATAYRQFFALYLRAKIEQSRDDVCYTAFIENLNNRDTHTTSDAEKGKKAIAEFGRNATTDDFPAGIDEEAFFRTVKHALGSYHVPDEDDTLFGIPEKRYEFDLNRPLKGRKFPLIKKERPEVIAAVAKLAGLSKVSNTEEYDVASDVVKIMKKLYRILQVHLVQKYDTINADLETNPNDKKNKMKDIEEKFWKIQKEITKL